MWIDSIAFMSFWRTPWRKRERVYDRQFAMALNGPLDVNSSCFISYNFTIKMNCKHQPFLFECDQCSSSKIGVNPRNILAVVFSWYKIV